MSLVVGGVTLITLAANMVGKDIVMKSMNRALTSTYGTVSWFMNYDQPCANTIVAEIRKSDIKFTLELIGKLVEDINNKKYEIESKSILYALEQVSVQLDIVNGELREIQYSIENHKQKYFSNWRCLVSKSSIASIITNKQILENRYKQLIKLLTISNKHLS